MQDERNIKYSQNFLRNGALVVSLLDKTSISRQDTVIEIGPGKGIITEKLLKRCKHLVAIEKDLKLFSYLKGRFKNMDNITIINGDFLEEDIDFSSKKIFSNIPFNITAEIINKITESYYNSPLDTYIFLEKDAAKKYAGRQYNGKENLSSLLLKPWFDLSVTHKISQSDFLPQPSVEVVLMQIERRKKPLVKKENKDKYNDFLSYTFSQWKPNVKENFKNIFSFRQRMKLANDLGFSLTDTLTDLTFDQYLGVFNYFLIGVSEEKEKQIYGSYKKLKSKQVKLEKIYRSRTSKNWKK